MTMISSSVSEPAATLPMDLRQRPPRSPRVRLGGFVILPRVLDKARATLSATQGEYKYANPLDRIFLDFTGIAPETFLDKVKTGAGDGEVLAWVLEQSGRAPHEVAAWSEWAATVALNGVEDRNWFTGEIERLGPARTDINTLFDYLDLDDHVTFGGLS